MLSFLFSLMIFPTPLVISDFSEITELKNWVVVNDGVMGGKSAGEISISEEGYAVFKGDVSLENYGGFTSIRNSFKTKDISGATNVKIKLRGDRKNYQFRVKNESSQRHSYKYEFKTSGNWETITIPLKKMEPTYRGYTPDLPNFKAENLSQIGFLIANKKNESFELLIERVWLE